MKEGDQDKLDLVLKDFDKVSADLRQRRRCRHTLFIATIGGVVTSGLAMIGFIQVGDPDQWYKWVLLGTMILFFITSIGILTSINKARAINLRSAYLATLVYNIQKSRSVPNFGGWVNAIRAARICANLTHASRNGFAPCHRAVKEYCSTRAKSRADLSNENVQTWRRDILKSFSVLTSIIYAVLYVLVGLILIGAAALILHKSEGTDVVLLDWQAFLYGCVLAGLLTLAAIATSFLKGRSPQSARLVISYIMLVIGGLVLVGATIFRLPLLKQPLEWTVMFAWVGGVLVVVGLGTQLYDQVYKVRKADYSSETYYHLWRLRFERCPLMSGRAIYKASQIPGKGQYSCLNYDCSKTQEIKNDNSPLIPCTKCKHTLFCENLQN